MISPRQTPALVGREGRCHPLGFTFIMAYFSIPPHPVPYSQMSHRIDDYTPAVEGEEEKKLDYHIGGRGRRCVTSSSGSWYLAR